MAPADRFDRGAPLPPGLEVSAIRKAIEYVERELADWVDLYLEQANVFSAVVGILGAKALDSVSAYERHRNLDTMQQRFPDLKMRGSGPIPIPNHCLESKGSKRPKLVNGGLGGGDESSAKSGGGGKKRGGGGKHKKG